MAVDAKGNDRPERDEASAPRPEAAGVLAVHDEGEGLLALYLTPALPPAALAAELGLESLVDVTPGPGPSEPLSLGELVVRPPPCELLHATDELPERTTLMAAPHQALVAGRRVAIAIQDPFHAVVYSRELEVIRAAVRTWLVARLDATIGSDAPIVEGRHLESLLEPLPDGSWRQLEVATHTAFWALAFTEVSIDGAGRPHVGDPTRWIGAPGGSWRAGWSW